MEKYSYEFKKKVVTEYKEGGGGYRYLSKKHEIGKGDTKSLRAWVKAYEKYGEKALKSTKKEKYTFEFKISVVKLYLASEVSYQELAIRKEIKNPSTLVTWVRQFRAGGSDALKSKGELKMAKPKKEESNQLEELKAENLKLRIENAYLKELRRLRLEEEALNKKRELSIVSEENSD